MQALLPHIEALIFASDRPLTTSELTDYARKLSSLKDTTLALPSLTPEVMQDIIATIIRKYETSAYPFTVRQSGGGWQFLSKASFYPTIALLHKEKLAKKLSVAALETLAIVAYKQPIAKYEIEAIRGVSSDYALQKLLDRELVMIKGRDETRVGRPILYATTGRFIDYLGIQSLEELPQYGELKDILKSDVP